ncbi:MAG: DNA adenine methylase [Roseburia sp.]|nr:DNA adenine methylase [Roseburia sp.]
MLIKAFRWYGGKIRMVDKINFLIPEHTQYYEPFMGSGAVLLNHPRSKLEVINDLDADLVHFMQTLADNVLGAELIGRLSKLYYEKWVFDDAMESKKKHFRNMTAIDKAVATYVLITQSFNCTRKGFGRKMYKDTDAYRADICFNLPKVHERLKGVHILNMNGIDLLEKVADYQDAFVFTDPPYRHDLRGKGADSAYACELPHSEQIRLLKTIRNAKCKIMLCGYRNENGRDLYDTYLLPYGWCCYKLADIPKSCQAMKKERDMGQEYIWVNYELPEHARYVISLKEYSSL